MNLKLFYNVSKLFLSIECNYKYAYKGALKSHKSNHIKEKLLDEKKITKGSKVHSNMNFCVINVIMYLIIRGHLCFNLLHISLFILIKC